MFGRPFLRRRSPTVQSLYYGREATALYEYARDKVFGIDFDDKSVRVARCLNLIAGDGETNVLHLNALIGRNGMRPPSKKSGQTRITTAGRSCASSRPAKATTATSSSTPHGQSTVCWDIKQSDMLAPYDLAHKLNKDGSLGKLESAVGRDLLFIERNLDFLRRRRMAIVLLRVVSTTAATSGSAVHRRALPHPRSRRPRSEHFKPTLELKPASSLCRSGTTIRMSVDVPESG